jgi:hypothetical protein
MTVCLFDLEYSILQTLRLQLAQFLKLLLAPRTDSVSYIKAADTLTVGSPLNVKLASIDFSVLIRYSCSTLLGHIMYTCDSRGKDCFSSTDKSPASKLRTNSPRLTLSSSGNS